MTKVSEVKVIGHRGAPRKSRENTIESFVTAAEDGADGVELDVRRTADAALVVHHDAALADGRLIVESRRSDLPAWLPDLDAVLRACAGLAVINVEIKNWPLDPDFDPDDSIAPRVAAVVRERDLVDRVIVSSFNPRTIDASRRAAPDIATGLLVSPGSDPASQIDAVVAGGHAALHPHDIDVTAELVEGAHRAGLALNVWTVDDVARIKQLAAWRVDGIVTNTPDIARAALATS